MSSFTFSNNDQGPPADGAGTTTAVSCDNGWACEHRWRTTANLVGFRNTVAGTGVSNWWSNGCEPDRVRPQRQGVRRLQP